MMSKKKYHNRLDQVFSEMVESMPEAAMNPAEGPKHIKESSPAILYNFFSQVSSVQWAALAYLGAITLAETLTTLLAPLVGIIMHGLILLALILHTAHSESLFTRRFLLSLSIAPLTRLLSMAMPLQEFPLVYWYVLVGAPLLLVAFYIARVGQFSREMLGLSGRKPLLQLLIGLTGIGLGYVEYLILRPEPLVTELSLELVWMPALILLIFTGLLEEFVFRGLMQSAARDSIGRAGITFSALVFAVMHLGYRSWVDFLFVFIVALFFGWVVLRTRSILGVTIAHGLTNIGLFLVFPFLLAPVQTVQTSLPPDSQPGISQPLLIETSLHLAESELVPVNEIGLEPHYRIPAEPLGRDWGQPFFQLGTVLRHEGNKNEVVLIPEDNFINRFKEIHGINSH
jgi:uncharacterized protein